MPCLPEIAAVQMGPRKKRLRVKKADRSKFKEQQDVSICSTGSHGSPGGGVASNVSMSSQTGVSPKVNMPPTTTGEGVSPGTSAVGVSPGAAVGVSPGAAVGVSPRTTVVRMSPTVGMSSGVMGMGVSPKLNGSFTVSYDYTANQEAGNTMKTMEELSQLFSFQSEGSEFHWRTSTPPAPFRPTKRLRPSHDVASPHSCQDNSDISHLVATLRAKIQETAGPHPHEQEMPRPTDGTWIHPPDDNLPRPPTDGNGPLVPKAALNMDKTEYLCDGGKSIREDELEEEEEVKDKGMEEERKERGEGDEWDCTEEEEEEEQTFWLLAAEQLNALTSGDSTKETTARPALGGGGGGVAALGGGGGGVAAGSVCSTNASTYVSKPAMRPAMSPLPHSVSPLPHSGVAIPSKSEPSDDPLLTGRGGVHRVSGVERLRALPAAGGTRNGDPLPGIQGGRHHVSLLATRGWHCDTPNRRGGASTVSSQPMRGGACDAPLPTTRGAPNNVSLPSRENQSNSVPLPALSSSSSFPAVRGGTRDAPLAARRGGPNNIPLQARGGGHSGVPLPAARVGGSGVLLPARRNGPRGVPSRGGPRDIPSRGGPRDIPSRGGPRDVPSRGGPRGTPLPVTRDRPTGVSSPAAIGGPGGVPLPVTRGGSTNVPTSNEFGTSNRSICDTSSPITGGGPPRASYLRVHPLVRPSSVRSVSNDGNRNAETRVMPDSGTGHHDRMSRRGNRRHAHSYRGQGCGSRGAVYDRTDGGRGFDESGCDVDRHNAWCSIDGGGDGISTGGCGDRGGCGRVHGICDKSMASSDKDSGCGSGKQGGRSEAQGPQNLAGDMTCGMKELEEAELEEESECDLIFQALVRQT